VCSKKFIFLLENKTKTLYTFIFEPFFRRVGGGEEYFATMMHF
jgi:hypothetical protein